MTTRGWIGGLAFLVLAAGCGSTAADRPQPKADVAGPAPEIRAGFAAGYLPRGAAPSSLAIVPPPPAPGSAAQARDDEGAKAAVALQGGPRWLQATQDAELKFPAAAETFACALDVEISEAGTPRLYALLRRTMTDVGLSTYPTKTRYQRARPFTVNAAPTCTPAWEAGLRKDGSYPSGHSAVGWGWALILAEAAPDRKDAVLARGRAFGQSRVVCNVHWLSDTEEGRLVASATVATLHGQPEFRADLEAARAEIAAARAAGRHPGRDCAKEAAQLAAG
jgi:acid phosphatase (class A)